jgi:hypothetical protein
METASAAAPSATSAALFNQGPDSAPAKEVTTSQPLFF